MRLGISAMKTIKSNTNSKLCTYNLISNQQIKVRFKLFTDSCSLAFQGFVFLHWLCYFWWK